MLHLANKTNKSKRSPSAISYLVFGRSAAALGRQTHLDGITSSYSLRLAGRMLISHYCHYSMSLSQAMCHSIVPQFQSSQHPGPRGRANLRVASCRCVHVLVSPRFPMPRVGWRGPGRGGRTLPVALLVHLGQPAQHERNHAIALIQLMIPESSYSD